MADKKKNHVMVDLETLGTKPWSVIISIGAVMFDPRGELGEEFYCKIEPQSCVDAGLKIDVSTVMWWMRQSDEARREFCSTGLPLSEALVKFSTWLTDPDIRVWGNGASFDNTLLSVAYERARISRPWKYTNDRCYRTMKSIFPGVSMARSGTHHNALDDARTQAKHLIEIFKSVPEGIPSV